MINERVFHLSGHETHEELCEYIKNAKVDTLLFSLPRSTYLFQQKTVFSQLRDCADEYGKILIIITTNALARQEIQALGIDTMSTLEDREQTPYAKNRDNFKSPNIAYIPIDPSKKKKIKEEDGDLIQENPFFARPTIHAMLILASMALALFIFIIQVAIPSATISINPAKKGEEMHLNVHFLEKHQYEEKDLWKKNNGIFMIPLEKVFVHESTYSEVSKEFEGESATGRITLYNKTNEDMTLRGGTRVQDVNGILFTLDTWSNIPKGGEIQANVTGADNDAYGKIQGERGNIPENHELLIPGLNEETRTQVYAKAAIDFTGGETKWKYKVSNTDLKKAEEKWITEAKEKGIMEVDYLFKQLQESETEEHSLLPRSGQNIHFEMLEIIYSPVKEELLGQELSSFSGSVRIRVKNHAYNIDHLKDLFWAKYQRIAPDGMTLVSIDTSLFSPHIQWVNHEKGEIKVSFSVSGVYEFIMEPKGEKGYQFIEQIKRDILKMPKTDAFNMLNNMKEIEKVEIDLWPFWVRALPSLPEKIKVNVL